MIPASYFFKSYDTQWWLNLFEPEPTSEPVQKPRRGRFVPALFAWLASRLRRPAHIEGAMCSAVER